MSDDDKKNTGKSGDSGSGTGNPDPHKVFTKEDVVLYIFTAFLIIGVSIFFFRAENRQVELIKLGYEKEVAEDVKIDPQDSLELNYYRAQTQMNNRLIGHSSRGLVASSSIKYIAFLIGIVMIFLGAIMIIRGIRIDATNLKGNFNEQIKFKLVSSSPGVIMTFLGFALLVTTILKSSSVDLKNFKVDPYDVNHYYYRGAEVEGSGISTQPNPWLKLGKKDSIGN